MKWRAGVQTRYKIQFILLSLLPLPIYLQLNEMLLLRKLTSEVVRGPKLPERETKSGGAQEMLKTMKTTTKKARREFMFRTARIVKGVENQINFTKLIGLRKQVLKIKWKFVDENCLERSSCSWQIVCNCNRCRNTRTIF